MTGASSGALGGAGLGALLTAAGVVAIGPVAARPAGSVIGAPIARLRGIPGALARRNAVRTPRRTAATASALMIGIGVVTVFTVFAGSLKSSVDDNVGAVIDGDLVIAASEFGGGGLSPGIVDAIDALPEVDHAVGVGTGPVSIDGRTRQVTVLDPSPAAAWSCRTRSTGRRSPSSATTSSPSPSRSPTTTAGRSAPSSTCDSPTARRSGSRSRRSTSRRPRCKT